MSDVAKGIARIASPRTLGMMANRRFFVNWRGSLKKHGSQNLTNRVINNLPVVVVLFFLFLIQGGHFVL